jgi:PST family polysaccharide transporter
VALIAHRRSLIQNTTALFGAQAIGLLVPLLTVPYLARTLRPEGWASVLVAQALGNWLILLIEYAFDLSGTREVARARATPDTMSHVVAGVQGAKLLLVPAATLLAVLALFTYPPLRDQGRLLGWALAFAVLRGLSPLWYFQGVERMRAAVGVDAAAKAAAAVGVFVLVRSPADGWRVLALQAGFAGLSLVVLTTRMAREVRWRAPTMRASLATLRRTAGVFGVRAGSGLFIQANTLILAALAGPTTVSFFGGAERIIRASINLLQPLTQAFLPRISYLSVADPARGRRMVERCLLLVGGLGAAFGIVAFVGAPLLTRVLLGPGYDAAASVLRVLAVLPVLVALDTVLGLYWAVPFGHERAFLASVLFAGATNVVLAFLLVPWWGAVGMGAAVVLAELTILVTLSWRFLRGRATTAAPVPTTP